jgi:hypothetical protein
MRCQPCVGALEARTLLSNVVTVTNNNDSGTGSLRDAINNAVSGEVINFAPSAYGTITLTNGPLFVNMINLTIQGPGANKLTVSGGGTTTDFVLFSVLPPTNPPPPTFVPNSVGISGLTIANGDSDSNGFGAGGGILSFDALTVTGSVFQNDQAPNGIGGAIYNGGGDNSALTAVNDVFTGNISGSATTSNAFSMGGAIFNGGTTTIQASTFINNEAIGPNALGGAIHTTFGATLTISGSTFRNNQALGTMLGEGGAIFGDPGFVNVYSSGFWNNVAEGDTEFGTDAGGAIVTTALDYTNIGTIGPNQVTEPIIDCVFSGNVALGAPGSGASVMGGAILNYDGILDVAGSTFIGNQAVGGSTTSFGATSGGGAIQTFGAVADLTSDSFLNNLAEGGSSPLGASFAGGGAVNLFLGNQLAPNPISTISSCTFAQNAAVGGAGGGSGAFTFGGAVVLEASPAAINGSKFLANQVIGGAGAAGAAGAEADGGAIWAAGSTLTMQGDAIVGNRATGGAGGDNPGGTGGNGGIANGGGILGIGGESISISDTNITSNSATGGTGGQGSAAGVGGNGQGGGIAVEFASTLTLTSSFVVANVAAGSAGGGDGDGGGIYTTGTATLAGTLVTLNQAEGGSGGGQGVGGGLYIGAGSMTLTGKTAVVQNLATTSNNNIFGTYST